MYDVQYNQNKEGIYGKLGNDKLSNYFLCRNCKSSYIEAARKAQEYEFDKAEELIKEGDAIYIKGHEAHASLIQQEARGESVAVNMLLMHAEDQLMAAENFKAFAQQQIVIFKKFQDIENR